MPRDIVPLTRALDDATLGNQTEPCTGYSRHGTSHRDCPRPRGRESIL